MGISERNKGREKEAHGHAQAIGAERQKEEASTMVKQKKKKEKKKGTQSQKRAKGRTIMGPRCEGGKDAGRKKWCVVVGGTGSSVKRKKGKSEG